MKKVTTLVLMLCLILSGALCYARGVARTDNGNEKDGTPIEVNGALWETITDRQVNHCEIIRTFAMILVQKEQDANDKQINL